MLLPLPGGLQAVACCLRHSGAWGSYQLQKQLSMFPADGAPAPQQSEKPGLPLLRPARLAVDAVVVPFPAAVRSLHLYGFDGPDGAVFTTWPWPIFSP